MTDSSDTADEHTTASHGESGSPTTTAETPTTAAGSVWSKLNRTNRILTIVLGSIVAVLIAAVAFGLGVVVGAENGGYDEHGGDRGSSEDHNEHSDGPYEQDGQEQDAHPADDHDGDGDSVDIDHNGPDQQAGPGAAGGRTIEPAPAPNPLR